MLFVCRIQDDGMTSQCLLSSFLSSVATELLFVEDEEPAVLAGCRGVKQNGLPPLEPQSRFGGKLLEI